MTFTEAAEYVLAQAKEPLHFREITRRAIEEDLIEVEGETPWNSMNGSLRRLIRREGQDARILSLGDGRFALCEWGLEGEPLGAAAGGEPERSGDDDDARVTRPDLAPGKGWASSADLKWRSIDDRLDLMLDRWLKYPSVLQMQTALSSLLVWASSNLLTGLVLLLGRRSQFVRGMAEQLILWGGANMALALTGLDGMRQQERLSDERRADSAGTKLQMLWARKLLAVITGAGLLAMWFGSRLSRKGEEGSRQQGAGVALFAQGSFWALLAALNGYLIGRRLSRR